MFCTKCGSQSSEDAGFCQKCGAKLLRDESPTQVHTESVASVAPIVSVSVAEQRPAASSENIASPDGNNGDDLLKTLIGKNSDYYLAQFDKIGRGEKSFNWCAFLIAPIVLLYRKQFSYFLKLLLPVYALLFVESLVAGYATATFNLTLMAVTPIIGLVIGIYAIVTAIICGKEFNKRYKMSLNTVVLGNQVNPNDEKTVKKLQPSTLTPIMFVVLYAVFSVALNFAIGAIIDNSLMNSFNDDYGAYDDFNDEDSISLTAGDITLMQTYTNEEHGFSFNYPSDWINGGSQSVTEIIRVYDGYGASFSVNEIYTLPFELGTGDETLIEAAINDNGILPYKFVSVDNVGVNGKVMRELIYTFEDAVHGLLYVSNYFYFVEDKDYQIKVELPADTVDNYQSVFEAMMNSYTITFDATDITPAQESSNNAAPENPYPGEVLYKGLPIGRFLGESEAELTNAMGNPLNITEEGFYDYRQYEYDDIVFILLNETGVVNSVQPNPSAVSVDGITLDKNRVGLIDLLGTPAEDDWYYDEYEENIEGYTVMYHLAEFSIRFQMKEPAQKAEWVTIFPKQAADEIILSNSELKDLNVFLSNFVEVSFSEYMEGWTKTGALISFALLHNELNYNSRFSYEELQGTQYTYYQVIDGSHITDTIKRFFNQAITLYTDEDYGFIYENGKLYTPAADGEFYGYLAQVERIEDNLDGTYEVYFRIYETEYDYQLDKELYNPVSTWSMEMHTHAASTDRTGVATVKKVTLNGRDTYQLVRYMAG